MTWRFDPPLPLTAVQITQILRELFSAIPDQQKDALAVSAPTLSQHLVENEA